MDGVSAAAAAVGLVQAAAQVTAVLSRYISSVKSTQSARTQLLNQIRLITAAETAIESVVLNAPLSLRTPQLQALLDEWSKADGTPARCKRELEALTVWLEGQVEPRTRNKWATSLVWPLKEDKIRTTVRTLEGYIPYFRDILSIDTFNLVRDIATQTRDSELVSVKSELLVWLDGLDCTNKHEFTLRQRQATTGVWLFKEELYIDWRNGSTTFIWLHGKAGAGKSVLLSAVIDDLSNGLADDETLAYFYCDFRNSRCTSAEEVLRSVLKQILRNSKDNWISLFSDLATRRERGAGPPTDLDILSDLLERAARLHTRPIIFVDALDECEDMSKLLDQLVKLSHGRYRLFVTSRTLYTVKEAFTGLPSISLDERVDEVRNDMYFHIKTELQSRSRLKTLKQDLKHEIEDALMRKADGMFRWVQCQLDRLNDCWSIGDVREVIYTLPRTLYDTYDQMLRAIDKKEFASRIAQKALIWLVLAVKPLRLSQLSEVLRIHHDETALDLTNSPMHDVDILEICGPLVAFDEENKTVTLSHYSVKVCILISAKFGDGCDAVDPQEYLTSDAILNKTYFVAQCYGSMELASVSIRSIMLFTDGANDVTMTEDHLCTYAADTGFEHLANCHPDHNEPLVRLLLSFEVHVSLRRLFYDLQWRLKGWMTNTRQLALYIIIRFGHLSMLQHYLDHHAVQATEEDNPLVFAALYSDVPRLQLLLDKGLDANSEGRVFDQVICKTSPLIAAAKNRTPERQEPLVRLLLAHGCIVPRDVISAILLSRLDGPCKPVVVQTLLENGADPQCLVVKGRTCLHLITESQPRTPRSSYSSDIEIARMLVTMGGDPMALNDDGFSPFHTAIKRLWIDFVQWLVERGFQLPSDAILHLVSAIVPLLCDYASLTVLRMLRLFIAEGVDFNVRDPEGFGALHLIRYYMPPELKEAVIEVLLDQGCDVNGQNQAGETPLHFIAANADRLTTVELLITRGAQLPANIVNYAIQSSHFLSAAQDAGGWITTFLVPLVQKYGASCRSVTLGGDNAMHCLLNLERQSIGDGAAMCAFARFLLENGCDIRAANSWGATPLQLAIENGHFSIAEMIFSRLVSSPLAIASLRIHATLDHRGNGILHRLCYKLRESEIQEVDFMNRLRMLQLLGYDLAMDINWPNHKGFTPLSIVLTTAKLALSDPAAATISRLLSFGARFSDVTPLYRDSIQCASHLPWYHEVKEAYYLSLSRLPQTFDDVTRVYHLLRLVPLPGFSPPVARLVMDMAEYWAHFKVVRNDIRYTTTYGGMPIPLPVPPNDSGTWTPRRVLFACKADVAQDYVLRFLSIKVLLIRQNEIYTVPIHLEPRYKTVFDVWDEHTPAKQKRRERKKLRVKDLKPGDAFAVEFVSIIDDYFAFEFFQVEVCYSIGDRK